MIKIKIWVLLSAIGLSACTDSTGTYHENVDINYYQDNSKAGDLIVWGISPEITIKTYVGDKQNIAEDKVLTSPFLGQFPIDFQPSKQMIDAHDKIENVADFENPMQFNLLLNQVKNVPINKFHDRNYKNQVKVVVRNLSTLDPIAIKYKRTPREWIDYFTWQPTIKHGSFMRDFGLECYSIRDLQPHITRFYHCIGNASDPYKSEFLMTINHHIQDHQMVVTIQVESPLYPNVRIEWTMPYESLNDWKVIDQKIWRLIEIWNVKSRENSNLESL